MQEIDDPFAQSQDEDDPFANADDSRQGGGPFVPKPALEDLEGRLVVMVPRALDKEAPKAQQYWKDKNVPETQERYTVDLVVLDGGPLTYTYKDKQQTGNGGVTVTEKEFSVPELPFMFRDAWRNEASIIGQLRKVDGTKKPMLLGVLRKGPQADDRRAGKTWSDIAEAFTAWRASGRGNPPKFSWMVDVDAGEEPQNRRLALEWWNAARAEGYTLP